MSRYVLKHKFMRFEYEIFDDDQNTIGYANRYFKHIGQFFGMFFGQHNVLNVKIENEKRKKIVQLKSVSHFWAALKMWEGVIYGSPDVQFHLQQTEPFKLGFHAKLTINDAVLYIKDRTIGAEPHFFDSDDKLLAKCRDNFAGKVHIDILDKNLNVYLIAAVAYLIKQY